jgi:hypothetical protein
VKIAAEEQRLLRAAGQSDFSKMSKMSVNIGQESGGQVLRAGGLSYQSGRRRKKTRGLDLVKCRVLCSGLMM